MEVIEQLQSFLIGLIGWAATVALVLGSQRLSENDQRAMVVCSWGLWMIPALGALVYRGLISTQTAGFSVGATTVALGLIMLLGALARLRTRP